MKNRSKTEGTTDYCPTTMCITVDVTVAYTVVVVRSHSPTSFPRSSIHTEHIVILSTWTIYLILVSTGIV
jgi:hypothetical protein